jgi:tRNA dimethylallyltransferase
MSLEDCVGELKKATRHYAKRQLTWFRKEKEFVPVFIDQCDSAELYSAVKELLEKGLAT